MDGKTTRVVMLLLFILAVNLIGCSPTQYIVRSMDPLMASMNTAVNKNPDVDMVRDALPATLLQLDGLIEASPGPTLLLRASEAYFGYTFAFVEKEDRERARMLYLKARDYALRVLFENEEVKDNFNSGIDAFRGSLEGLDRDDVPALYWAANTWMAWIALNLEDPEVLLDIPKVEAMLLRSVELDDTYYYGGAHAVLGAFYASRSKVLGGDPEKAKYHFDRAFEISGSRLLFVHLLYAQYYAYQVQDRDIFVETLERVIETPVGYFPEKNFANEVAKKKARELLEQVDTYF